VLVDKKILIPGIVMIIIGLTLSAYLSSIAPVGKTGMTEDEVLTLMMEQQQNDDYSLLAGIVVGIGFLFILISFGATRRRKGGAKKVEKKPAR